MSRPCSDLPVVHTQVLGVDDPLACRALHDAIQSLPGGSGAGEEAVSPLEAVRRLLNQPVYVEAATAEELHAKVRSVLTVLGANHGPLECPPPIARSCTPRCGRELTVLTSESGGESGCELGVLLVVAPLERSTQFANPVFAFSPTPSPYSSPSAA